MSAFCLVLLPVNETIMHRVMSKMETGEEMCIFEGSEYQCFRWIQDNAENYPECRLYSEPICPPHEDIITEFINPPIPSRLCDWSAQRANYEPGDCIGYGPTKEKAIEDLLEQEELEHWDDKDD